MLVACCGLHGGAGTTTTAVLLARAAAQRMPGQVLLCDAAPAAGDLALALGAQSPHNLAELAVMAAERRQPHTAAHVELDGLRLLARAPGQRPAGAPKALARVLAEATAAHQLTIIDAGAITAAHASEPLAQADVVLWCIDATTHPQRSAHLLASDLASEARSARWQLVAHATGRDGQPAAATLLPELMPTLTSTVLVPRLTDLQAGDPALQLAATHLLSAIA